MASILKEAKAEKGYEWKDTGKLLKKAEAKKALKQAKDVQAQAEKYITAGPTF